MRNKLIELIRNTPPMPCIKNGRANGKTIQTIQNMVDHLIKNGVVILTHGKWEKVKYIEGCLNSYQHTCGCCGKSYFDNNVNDYPFCPFCGAKMDGDENE